MIAPIAQAAITVALPLDQAVPGYEWIRCGARCFGDGFTCGQIHRAI